MPERILIPLPGIGTLSLTRAEYDAALIPIPKPEVPKAAPIPRSEPAKPALANPAAKPPILRYLRQREVRERVGISQSTLYRMMATGAFPDK